jgi:hypothetical protein
MTQPGWSVQYFFQTSPFDPGQDDIPAQLRRVADTIEEYGNIQVQDLVVHIPPTADQDMKITVYFHPRDDAGC